MPQIFTEITGLAWPFAIALAWTLGELLFRWTDLPRISTYALTGFVLSHAQAGILPQPNDGIAILIANIAFGLVLFEFGYRVNLRWLRANPWIGMTGLLESGATFAVVYWVAARTGMDPLAAMLLAALAIATSPAELMRVVNDQHCSGQSTERTVHLAALNCVVAVFAFNLIVGLSTFQSSGSVWDAAWNSLIMLLVSVGIGATFGAAVPALLRKLGGLERNATIAFAIAVIVLMSLAHTLKMSPVVAALAFGFVARHRRMTLSQAQRNFGVLGDLLMVLLFVFIGATLAWQQVMSGMAIAIALLGMRFLTKVAGAAVFARLSGTSWRKGLLTGIALSPMSVIVVFLLVQTNYRLGLDLMEQLAPLAAATLLSAILGPMLTQRALIMARESSDTPEY